jgi:ATP-dependent RNA helicase HelY
MTLLDRFESRYPFALDDFQLEAIHALDLGESVLVAAPTGSGKTVVAEFAVERALELGGKVFYTTPLKALSNQKFGDFVARHGAARVGLLTGDNSINSEAPVVVMTTEVLRNLLYVRSDTLDGLLHVVLDEVHYLQDPYRGAVWEEVLIHLPLSASVVCLSATVSNAEEFGEWVGTLRGPTRVVIEERRPVPLEHHYLIGHELHPMHVQRDGQLWPNPYVASLDQREARYREYRRVDGGRQSQRVSRPREGHRRMFVPRREDVVEVLNGAGMLPAIYFVFSRVGCDRSVEFVVDSGLRLTSREEEARIREFAEMRAASLEEEDLATLGFFEFREALAVGVAAHHAGMLPLFKETVEELFKAGLVKVVFATETLSLGINMPARSVVIEDLWKFSGERHELLTPGEYTQLTGRAGRRGIDQVGHAVTLFQKQVPFDRVASLASTRTYELTSSFRPAYNMAVNLVRNYTPDEAHHLLNSSFAQFKADRSVVARERELERDLAALQGYREQMACDRGDFAEYWALRERARLLRQESRGGQERLRRDAVTRALASLRPGDVVFIPRARRRGLAVVLAVSDGRPLVMSQDRRPPRRLSANDFDDPPVPVTRIQLPRTGSARSARFRRDLAARLVALDVRMPPPWRSPVDSRSIARAESLDRKADEHPCHACPDRKTHERWATRASKLEERIEGTRRFIRSRTETLGKQFDRVLAVLESLGYVKDFQILPKGEALARIYGEGDILVAEALDAGHLRDLSPPELAAIMSTVVYESRDRVPRPGDMPTAASAARYRKLISTWRRIRRAEDGRQVELCRELEPGFATPVFHWAEGKPLEDVLGETGMAPGDFVRSCKLLLDLLRQVEDVADPETAALARAAHDAVNRGVVAYTGV